MRRGRLPDDRKALANLVANVSFYNIFGFPLGSAAGEHADLGFHPVELVQSTKAGGPHVQRGQRRKVHRKDAKARES